MSDQISSLDSGIQVLASKSVPQHLLLCDPGCYFTALCPSHHICKSDVITLVSSLGRSEDYLSLFICVKHVGTRLAQNKCLGNKMWASGVHFATTPSIHTSWFPFFSQANWDLRLRTFRVLQKGNGSPGVFDVRNQDLNVLPGAGKWRWHHLLGK